MDCKKLVAVQIKSFDFGQCSESVSRKLFDPVPSKVQYSDVGIMYENIIGNIDDLVMAEVQNFDVRRYILWNRYQGQHAAVHFVPLATA